MPCWLNTDCGQVYFNLVKSFTFIYYHWIALIVFFFFSQEIINEEFMGPKIACNNQVNVLVWICCRSNESFGFCFVIFIKSIWKWLSDLILIKKVGLPRAVSPMITCPSISYFSKGFCKELFRNHHLILSIILPIDWNFPLFNSNNSHKL